MARLIGALPFTNSEKLIYDFIMKELPDYIYAGFGLRIPITDDHFYECDFLLVIPHFGVFIMEVKGAKGMENVGGKWHLRYPNGDKKDFPFNQLGRYRYAVRDFLYKNYNVSPYISSMLCLPEMSRDNITGPLSSGISPDLIFFEEDFANEYTFMSKLLRGMHNNKMLFFDDSKFDDLSDRKAYEIFRNWDIEGTEQDGAEQVGRGQNGAEPVAMAKVPTAYVCYDSSDKRYAKDIIEDLEYRTICVKTGPDDILSCDAFVILLSSSAQENPGIRERLELAKSADKLIIPLWIDNAEPNDYYNQALTKTQFRPMIRPDYSIMCEIEKKIKEINQG